MIINYFTPGAAPRIDFFLTNHFQNIVPINEIISYFSAIDQK